MANSESIITSSSTSTLTTTASALKSESLTNEGNEHEIEGCEEIERNVNNITMISNNISIINSIPNTSINNSSSADKDVLVVNNNHNNNNDDDNNGVENDMKKRNQNRNDDNDKSNNNPSINNILSSETETTALITTNNCNDFETETEKAESRVDEKESRTKNLIENIKPPASTSALISYGMNQYNPSSSTGLTTITTTASSTTPIALQPLPSVLPPTSLIALSSVTQIPQLSPTMQIPQVPPTPLSSGSPLSSHHQPSIHSTSSSPASATPNPHHPPPPHHHHIFPLHVISIPQPPPSNSPAAAVTGAWPIMETPMYVDSKGESHPYCPAHSQGSVHREHRVILQLDAGISLPIQIGGKRKIFRENTRGRYPSNLSKEGNKTCPATVQMIPQSRPPPIPVPMQVQQSQVMQQYVNENGTLTHMVLSPTQYQQLHTGQGGVPHIHAPFITANGATSHFYGPLPAGFPGSGGGPHFHPMPAGHLSPQQMSHSPHSPSNNYHKDERTQRQHTKLLRKLDQKREISKIDSAFSTPAHSPSPRRSDLKRTSRNDTSSLGTSEDGEESSSVPDEDEFQTIIEQLSAVQKPEVTDITSRSAMIRWEAPLMAENLINDRELRYDVLLSDRGKEGKYKKILEYGESYVCMIRDLRPGQEYFVCLQVHYEKLVGCASEPAVFITPPCEPDQPIPPKLIARTKNSLQLRWNAPLDNGSHISNYVLEYGEGNGKEFLEIIKTKGKQYILTKLQSSTQYCFRLSAINDYGSSIYSDVVSYSTSGNPPSTPKPPTLLSATSNSLRLAWEKYSQDEEFVLQMADRESGHGFLNMYTGVETSYECKGLKRATNYQFRLRADNEAGSSPWSSEVTYKTYSEKPGKPSKPQVKGKIHGTYFKAKWDPPNDRGGSDIRMYFLEISSGAKFERIYTGNELETVCDRLSPGTTYQIRVGCEGPGGISNYSDISTVTTEAVVPGAPDPPFCDNPPGPYSAVLHWNKPDYNGGAPVLEYELILNGYNHNNKIIYRGKELYYVIKDLMPGKDYQVCVRAINRIGAGTASKIFTFSSGPAPPEAPDAPDIQIRSATHLTISWKEPITNGSPIIEYRLESLSSLANFSALSNAATTSINEVTSTAITSDNFNICYQGSQTTTDIRNLVPFSYYYFRICATNLAGTSPYSSVIQTQTPAACPSVPQFRNYEITAKEITLRWTEPECNGSKILYYVIEYGDYNKTSIASGSNLLSNVTNSNSIITTTSLLSSIQTEKNQTELTIKNLLSETYYKFKIQAVNEIGAGQFSNYLKLQTLPPPPKPPKLECSGTGHNFIKLKWGEGKNLDFITYYVEMYNQRSKEFQCVYNGTSFMCKVSKLQEQTSYIFRIYAETDRAGVGDYSDEYVFHTTATLPSSIKPPRIIYDANSNIHQQQFQNCSCNFITGNNNSTNDSQYNNNNNNNINNNNNNINNNNNNNNNTSNSSFGNVINSSMINHGNSISGITGTIATTAQNHILYYCNNNCLTIEWQHSKNTFTDPVEYILQCSYGKENDYVEIYRGSETRFTIENLESGLVYIFRVCPVRVTTMSGDLMGSFSSPLRYQVPQHRPSPDCVDSFNVATILPSSTNHHRSSHHHYHHHHHHHNLHQNVNTAIICSDILSHSLDSDNGNDYIIAKGSETTTVSPEGDGAIRRYFGKLQSIYSTRRRFSDQQKAVLLMFSFILLTICFAAIVNTFMR